MKKNRWERVVTSDGYAPLLFYLMLAIVLMLAGFFLHGWMNLGVQFLGW